MTLTPREVLTNGPFWRWQKPSCYYSCCYWWKNRKLPLQGTLMKNLPLLITKKTHFLILKQLLLMHFSKFLGKRLIAGLGCWCPNLFFALLLKFFFRMWDLLQVFLYFSLLCVSFFSFLNPLLHANIAIICCHFQRNRATAELAEEKRLYYAGKLHFL